LAHVFTYRSKALISFLGVNASFLCDVVIFKPGFKRNNHRARGQAFIAGDLTPDDYLPYDSSRGWHQFNDCNILQMMINQGSLDSRLEMVNPA
jgi:hypothetical protein